MHPLLGLQRGRRISSGGAMGSACRSSSCCVDAREPVRASYKVLYKWPESDVEFVKSVAAERPGDDHRVVAAADPGEGRKRPSVPVVDGFSCRQMYLRSYTFTIKKETVPEKTRRRLKKALSGRRSKASSEDSVTGSSEDEKKEEKKKKGKKDCANTRKLRAALQSAIRRLLLCAGAVGVVD